MRWILLLGLIGIACGPEANGPLYDTQGRLTSLSCPGAPGCRTAVGPIRVGVARRTITPEVETWTDSNDNNLFDEGEPFVDKNGNQKFDAVWLAGFGLARLALGVHDDNWTRAFVLERGELAVAVVSIDAIGIFQREVLRIREAVNERGLALDQVIVVSTHQHEGADTMGLWGRSFFESGVSEAYLDRIVALSVDAIGEAYETRREAKLRVAQGDASELISDSRLPTIVDGSVTIVQATDTGGAPILDWVIYGNHPESLGEHNQQISSDFPHYLREGLEAAHPGALAVFSAGSLGGMMSPLGIEGCADAEGVPRCRQGSFEFAEYLGSELSKEVVRALSSTAAEDLLDPGLEVSRLSFLAPAQNVALSTAMVAGIFTRRFFGADGSLLPKTPQLADLMLGKAHLEAEVNRLLIGSLEIVLVPAETYPELWLDRGGHSLVERPANADYPDVAIDPPISTLLHAPRRALVNQANDTLGYVIPKSQYDLEPPHAYAPSGQYGEANSVGPDIEPALFGALQALLGADR